MPYFDLASGYTATAAANTEVVLTINGAQGQQATAKAVYAYYTGGSGTGTLTIESPSGTVMARHPVVSNTLTLVFPESGIRAANGTNLVFRLSAGGASIVGIVNVLPTTAYRPV